MPWQKEAQQLVTKHMEEFFFGEGAALPPGYVPQQSQVIPARVRASARDCAIPIVESMREREPRMRGTNSSIGLTAVSARAKINPR